MRVHQVFDFDAEAEKAWNDALKLIEDSGEDVDDVLYRAARNIEYWRGRQCSHFPPSGEL